MFGECSGATGAAYGPQSGSESRISSSMVPLNASVASGAISQPHFPVELMNGCVHYTHRVGIS
ncbi:Uncharacterised protein [Mycobacterium tuberculosis]|nr:Uncharacterised protein [Mycobacterium tuberculosis]